VATNPKVYGEHYATRAAVFRGYHIGSLQELPYTICDPVVPLPVAFYDPQYGYSIPPHPRGATLGVPYCRPEGTIRTLHIRRPIL
jgi:hypothetical protein